MTMSMETSEKANEAYFADLKLVVSKWYDEHISINMLKVLYRDYVKDTFALREASKTMELINKLIGSGEFGPTDLTLIYDTIKVTQQFGLEQAIKKRIPSFQILDNIRNKVITKFTVHRLRLVKLGMVLTPDDVQTISDLYEVKHTDSWSLIMDLEHKMIICERKMDVFIEKLKQHELHQAVEALTEGSQGATGIVHHGFYHLPQTCKMATDKALYTFEGDNKQIICPFHCNNVLEFYCSICKKSACKQCEQFFHCFRKKHELIEMKTVIYDVINKPKDIQRKLNEKLDTINKDKAHLEDHVQLCRAAIEVKEKKLLIQIQEKSKTLRSDLEKIYKVTKENIESQVEDITEKLTQVNIVMDSINTRMNKPQEIETLVSHMTTINAFRDFDQSHNELDITTPKFIESTQLDELINTEGIGTITTVHGMYKVAKDDETITVTKGQPFLVAVSNLDGSDACELAANLRSSSGEESLPDVEYKGNGEYIITGTCHFEGDWKMMITAGEAHVKGSPVNIKVEMIGLVYTIDNISDYKQHEETQYVTDVVLHKDRCILVSSYSRDILKFNQLGLFVERIQVPENVQVNGMYLMGGSHLIYSDSLGKCVIMCDEKFQAIRSFGKGIFKNPDGLRVNEKTRVLYVTDSKAHCVLKFNVDDGELLGKIGSEGSEAGQMNTPYDIALTKEGYVIVAEGGNNRIQMFNANEKLMRILVGSGVEDGKVWGPCALLMDKDENIIVSSNHKLQLFDKNGVFIKRIDQEDDGLNVPAGITVISNKPRRVAVANQLKKNIKIFNY